jgi:hypothetical protein
VELNKSIHDFPAEYWHFSRITEKRGSRFTREYQNCGQLARMISTQLCDKQLFLGLDTFETFRENHQLMFMDCIHTKMFDVFSPRTIQSQLKSQLNN